jgi:hypothetical protein
MLAHHERTIQRLVERYGQDERFPALIVGGSVAKGLARPDSDVDVIFVATPAEFARRQAERDYFYHATAEFCDYPGGYVDGKVIDLQFLREAVDHGSEPARAAYAGAIVAYTREPEVNDLVARIPVYPEAEQQERMEAFYSQLVCMRWYMGEAVKRQDAYLRMHVAADMVLAGGRLILAYNKILYPFHKWFMTELRRAPLRPGDLPELAEALLADPTVATARAFFDSIVTYRDWGVPDHRAFSRFIEISEWNWRAGRPSLADW